MDNLEKYTGNPKMSLVKNTRKRRAQRSKTQEISYDANFKEPELVQDENKDNVRMFNFEDLMNSFKKASEENSTTFLKTINHNHAPCGIIKSESKKERISVKCTGINCDDIKCCNLLAEETPKSKLECMYQSIKVNPFIVADMGKKYEPGPEPHGQKCRRVTWKEDLISDKSS